MISSRLTLAAGLMLLLGGCGTDSTDESTTVTPTTNPPEVAATPTPTVAQTDEPVATPEPTKPARHRRCP